MRFLDTNVFLRYLTADDRPKAEACLRFFQRLKEGSEQAATCEAIITEIVYVLSSRSLYSLTHEEISTRLRPILALRGLRLPQKRLYFHALDIYASSPFLDFEDALCVAHMEQAGITEIVSYDTDFDRVPSIQRAEPQ